MSTTETVPLELRERPRWVLWRLEGRDGKKTKIPYQVKNPMREASSTDASSWASYEEAVSVVGADGIGFVLGDGIVGIDLDDCFDEEERIDPDAEFVVEQCATYTEWSPSHRGLHLLLFGELKVNKHRVTGPWDGHFEVYDRDRFFTITGERYRTSPTGLATNKQAELERVCNAVFEFHSDSTLLKSIRKSSPELFDRLFEEGDISGYNSPSEADLALANVLATKCKKADQLDRLMRRSALARDKWDGRDGDTTWLRKRVVDKALEGTGRSSYMTGDFETDVAAQMYTIQVREEARARIRSQELEQESFPYPEAAWSLADELILPPREEKWRVQDLQMLNANVVLIAGYKLGKTTLVMNLMRSLVDGTPFLGIYDVLPVDGNVAVFNYELDSEQWVDWARDMKIQNPDRIKPFHLRGLGTLQFWVPDVQDRLVEWMLENNIKYWILDPTSRAWEALLESEGDNIRAGQFVGAIDQVKGRAGIEESNLTHHTSRDPAAQDKARGPSRLEGWYDSGWFLTGKRDALRFHAIGRDVDVTSIPIMYSEDKARSFLIDTHSAKEAVQEKKDTKFAAIEVLHEMGELSQTALGKELRARGFGVGQTKLKSLLSHWAGSADNHIAFKEQRVDGRRQRTYYLDIQQPGIPKEE